MNDPFDGLPPSNDLQTENGVYKLFRLDIKAKKDINMGCLRVPQTTILRQLKEKLPSTINLFQENKPNSFTLYLTSSKQRDHLHSKHLTINGQLFKMEAYPPPKTEAPYWKEKPKELSTPLRLINIPPQIPLDDFEKSLISIPNYIPNSATFETFSDFKDIRNGNLTFYMKGNYRGVPGKYLRINGFEIEVQNEKSKNHQAPFYVPTCEEYLASIRIDSIPPEAPSKRIPSPTFQSSPPPKSPPPKSPPPNDSNQTQGSQTQPVSQPFNKKPTKKQQANPTQHFHETFTPPTTSDSDDYCTDEEFFDNFRGGYNLEKAMAHIYSNPENFNNPKLPKNGRKPPLNTKTPTKGERQRSNLFTKFGVRHYAQDQFN